MRKSGEKLAKGSKRTVASILLQCGTSLDAHRRRFLFAQGDFLPCIQRKTRSSKEAKDILQLDLLLRVNRNSHFH